MNEAVDCSLEHQKHPLFQSPMELTLLIPPKRNLHFHFSMTDLYGCTALHHVFAWHNSPEGLLWKCLMFRIGSLGAKLNHYLFFITLEHVFNHYTGRGSRKRIGIKKKKIFKPPTVLWLEHFIGWAESLRMWWSLKVVKCGYSTDSGEEWMTCICCICFRHIGDAWTPPSWIPNSCLRHITPRQAEDD